LPRGRQAQMLGLARSALYYKPQKKANNDAIIKRIEEVFLRQPYFGYRKITKVLQRENYAINSKKVRAIMRGLGLRAIYCKPNTSKACRANKVHPYLLKDLPITQPNQVWATDITYVKIAGKFHYLVAIIDWFSRYILAWNLSANMEVEFCTETLKEALAKAVPDIFNSDQGSQFTSFEFTKILQKRGVKISMDGKGSYRDNIFTERFWRSIKYEEIYLKEYKNMEDAEAQIGLYIAEYNAFRPHQSLNYQTPEAVHFAA
jgi:putative transposase